MTILLRHDYDMLLKHLLMGKLPRSLKWIEAIELVKDIGEVITHGEVEATFVIHGKRATFKRPHQDQFELEETSRLRKFLKEATESTDLPAKQHLNRMIVVIDHHAAHVFDNDGDGSQNLETSVEPYDPFGFHHHLIHRKEAHYRGDRIPEESSFYEEIARKLTPAGQIILIGHATGTSSAMEYLVEFLKSHHPEILKLVIATEVVDLSALTNPEIEAIAKKRLNDLDAISAT